MNENMPSYIVDASHKDQAYLNGHKKEKSVFYQKRICNTIIIKGIFSKGSIKFS